MDYKTSNFPDLQLVATTKIEVNLPEASQTAFLLGALPSPLSPVPLFSLAEQ